MKRLEDDCGRTARARIAAKRRAAKKARTAARVKYGLATGAALLIVLAGYTTGDKKAQELSGLSANRSVKTSRLLRNQIQYIAEVDGTSLRLAEPVDHSDLVGIGYHEAENRKARRLVPVGSYFADETTAGVAEAYKGGASVVSFVMTSRERGSDPKSSVDVAVRPNAVIKSPVDGVVSKVKEYYLYGRYFDYHVEIAPDGYPNLRVALIHIDKLSASKGMRVEAGKTKIGVVRVLEGLDTQINWYLPKPYDHVHIQVNPASEEARPIEQ